MKLFFTLLFVAFVTVQAFSQRRINKRPKSTPKYRGCKKEDTICSTRPRALCRISRNFRFQCPRKCGLCAHFAPKCPSEYKYGCCWDGTEAYDIAKSNCPKCVDINHKICKRKAITRDCDFAKNSPRTRLLCPVSCGACGDYGNENQSGLPCVDKDKRCELMKDTSCCENSEILQDLCRKTCGMCQ